MREETGLALGLQPSFGFENTNRIKQIVSTAQPDGSYSSKEIFNKEMKEVRMIYIIYSTRAYWFYLPVLNTYGVTVFHVPPSSLMMVVGRIEDNRMCCVFWWQVENVIAKKGKYGKVKALTKKNDITSVGLVSKKIKISGDKVKASDLIHLCLFILGGMGGITR